MAELRAGVTPHSLRHTYATEALRLGAALQDVQDALGHSDPRTARRYDRSRHTSIAPQLLACKALTSEDDEPFDGMPSNGTPLNMIAVQPKGSKVTESNNDNEDTSSPEIVAQVLRTLFAGSEGAPSPRPPETLLEETAIAWQRVGPTATFSEIHAVQNGADHGRGAELVGRVAAAGEQLGLGGTCLVEAQRWENAPRRETRGGDMATRALAEMAGYYATSTGHGLINVTLRTLLLSPTCASKINAQHKRATGFPPFTSTPAAWLFFNRAAADSLREAVVAANQSSVTSWFEIVAALESDPRWRALTDRRHEDFHRWRPQSITGGVPNQNPWENTSTGGSSLTIYGNSTYKPLDPVVLVTEAESGLMALGDAMRAWLEAWPTVLKDLGCPLFKVP